jgi:hypothetical protein
MPDITKCRGVDCPHRDGCYRYTSKPSDYQSYFMTPPIKDGKCDHYWGEQAESIWNQLNHILKPNDNDSRRNTSKDARRPRSRHNS